MIIVRAQDSVYFSVTAPCGCVWVGMRHSEDVSIIVNRAMDHGRCDTPSDVAKDHESRLGRR